MAGVAAIFLAGLAAPTIFRIVYRATTRVLAVEIAKDAATRPYISYEHSFPTVFSRSEALSALGVTSAASSQEVQQKYRDLIKELHSDTGGTPYIARRLNEAREAVQRK